VSATNDQRPPAVAATPNGVEGTGAIAVGTVLRAGAGAVAVLHPGARAGAVTWAAGTGRGRPAPPEAAVGGPAAGWDPAEQPATAITAAAAATTAATADLTPTG